ncbi:MAG: redox-regulated ATPase YchF, partial [Planctomycetes bacterium]|nr:redox-regulated ATPase YchF [Planctomycetota bacterium]
NQFLGNIRSTNVIVHVVRCFEDADITHVDGSIDPIRDIETIDTELIFSDLEVITRRKDSIKKHVRAGKKEAAAEEKLLEVLEKHLESGQPARSYEFNELEQEIISAVQLITIKPVLFCCNVDEGDVVTGNDMVRKVEKHASAMQAEVVWLCASMEAEIAELEDEEERQEFLSDLGLTQPGLEVLSVKSYNLLGLQTYFTAGEKEVRAWTFKRGSKAPQAAGVIHTDFERGFIRAETYSFADLMEYDSEKAIKEAGKLRVEGKEYVVEDGDIMHFLFNV